MVEAVLASKSIERLSDFDRIQIFALDVLDKGDFKEPVGCEILDNDRNLGQALLVGLPANGVRRRQADTVIGAPDDKRLYNSVGANGLREILQAFG